MVDFLTGRPIGKKKIAPIVVSRRSGCAVVIYRWNKSNIVKIEKSNASKEKIFSEGRRPTSGNLDLIEDPLVIRNDVIKCSINKNKGSSSGTFSIVLKRGKKVVNGRIQKDNINYLNSISPGDWILIYVKKSGKDILVGDTSSKSGLRMLGIIETVRYLEVDDPSKGSPRLEYLVTGRDFGKIFDMNVYFNPILNDKVIQKVLGSAFLEDSENTVRGSGGSSVERFSPDFVSKKLVDFYLGGNLDELNSTNQTWFIPRTLAEVFKPSTRKKAGGSSFIDILDTDKIGLHRNSLNKFSRATKLPGAVIIQSLPSSGTVWSILDFLKNSSINEMYTDLTEVRGRLVPSIVIRQVPFSNKNGPTNPFFVSALFGNPQSDTSLEKTFFVDLPRLNIVSSDIKQKNVGKSDYERINHILAIPRTYSDSGIMNVLFVSAMNVPSIQRHGLKSYRTQTPYVASTSDTDIKNYCQLCVDLLSDWFFLAHELYNGTIIIEGVDDHIELGNNVFIKDVQQLYHIEGYTVNYEQFSDGATAFTVELRVSRGQIFTNGVSRFISSFSDKAPEPTTITTSMLENRR